MSSSEQFAIFVDGGFLRKKIAWFYRRQETANDVVSYCDLITKLDYLKDLKLFRIYYYDAALTLTAKPHCLTGEQINFSEQPWFKSGQELIDLLKLKKNFAVRLGNVAFRGWKLKDDAIESIGEEYQKEKTKGYYKLMPDSFKPAIEQKGVDMRIGLDIANLAVKQIARHIVIVSGDADMIPAMKLARKEGVRVLVDFFGNKNKALIEHSDDVVYPIDREEIKKRQDEERKKRKL